MKYPYSHLNNIPHSNIILKNTHKRGDKVRKGETIEKDNQEFIPFDIRFIDSKNRITISEKILKKISGRNRINQFQVLVGQEGDILLRPLTAIPSREAWIYEKPELIKQIRQGLQEAKEGKTETLDNLEKISDES